MGKRPVLAVTPGDPAGIGPDLVVELASHRCTGRIVVIADRTILVERSRELGIKFDYHEFDCESSVAEGVEVLHVECGFPVQAGTADPRHAQYVLHTLDTAINGCLGNTFDALVTGPVNKETIIRSGIPFTGHTEYLAARTTTDCPVMLLAGGNLRVALVTTHLPLAQVPEAITQEKVIAIARVLHDDLSRRFRIESPRIGVCGVNPHAGEGGTLGHEEQTVLAPAIDRLQSEGVDISGPYPADTIFTKSQLTRFDAVLTMYHDQGLPVVKHAGFGQVVNITLGLPIIRTSVDHGTAYELAGTGKAQVGSLLSAISMAQTLAEGKSA